MPVYAYRGVTAGNRTARGMIDADSLRGARAKLRADGIFPTQISEGRTRTAAADFLARLQLPEMQRVPDLDLALFSSQLSTLVEAGVPLVESLSALTEQVENARLKAVTGRVRESVNEGASLADAMADHPQVFEPLYRSMVRAGETSGTLPLVMQRLADYVERRMELRNQVISAMIYPALMLAVSGAVLGFMLVTVIPQITVLLEDMNQDLPMLTRVVVAISDFLVDWWLALIVTIGLAILAMNRAVQTEWGRYRWDRFRLGLPVLGRVQRYVAIARFTRTLSTLLAGGVNIVPALEIARSVSGNAVIARAVDAAAAAITRGATIAQPLRESGEFPPLVTHMISVGEASGELEGMLVKVANTYDDLVGNALGRLWAVMGPLLLILVAGIVVIVILSTLLPLMNLTAAL